MLRELGNARLGQRFGFVFLIVEGWGGGPQAPVKSAAEEHNHEKNGCKGCW